MQIDPEKLKVQHIQDDPPRFEVRVGEHGGVLHYHLEGQRMVFTHTEVDPALEGQGIAGKMARTALDWARGQGYQVEPLCPYIASYIKRHPEYQAMTLGYQGG